MDLSSEAGLTQEEFDLGLIRALEDSLAETHGKGLYFELGDPPAGSTAKVYEGFRELVRTHQFKALREVKAWLSGAESSSVDADDEDQLAARRFLWRLRLNVSSRPIYWRGRVAVGESAR
jgi:hypothetical protein